jgi:hypothetical protein
VRGDKPLVVARGSTPLWVTVAVYIRKVKIRQMISGLVVPELEQQKDRHQGVGKHGNPLASDARDRWFESSHPDFQKINRARWSCGSIIP